MADLTFEALQKSFIIQSPDVVNRNIRCQNSLNQHIILGKSFQREAEIEQMLVHQIPIDVKHATSARFARFRLQTDIRNTVFAPHKGALFPLLPV